MKSSVVKNRKFKLDSRVISFRFKEIPENMTLETFLLSGFAEILSISKKNVDHEDEMGIKINIINRF